MQLNEDRRIVDASGTAGKYRCIYIMHGKLNQSHGTLLRASSDTKLLGAGASQLQQATLCTLEGGASSMREERWQNKVRSDMYVVDKGIVEYFLNPHIRFRLSQCC